MAGREPIEQALIRWKKLEALQEAYPHFKDFVHDGMTDLMGFQCSPLQEDIADYLQHGNKYRMIMAQRGQAKTTITAFYAVWRIIHDPSTRVLIFSAGGDMASEISNWIIQIVRGWDILECLKPDTSAGDRSSVMAFDVHHSLKGLEKSPSVACMGVTASMQGRRADVIIADDIESSKNSMTDLMREQLIHKTRDFTSICATGDIVFLGTPQSQESIYNTLPSRGYDIRIWPGRYPTLKEREAYGTYLAPYIKERITEYNTTGYGVKGDRGEPVDPIIQDEESLQQKELDQGQAYFQLQYMLDTSLVDLTRFPLKTKNLIVAALDMKEAPVSFKWLPDPSKRVQVLGANNYEFYRPHSASTEMEHYKEKIMYVDPSGRGDDETAYCVMYMMHGTLFLMDIGGVDGGFTDDTFLDLSRVAYKHGVHRIIVESNFADGGFSAVWKPKLDNYYEEWSKGDKKFGAEIIDDRVSTQKEVRIIDILEPLLARHSLIVDEEVIRKDVNECQRYPIEKRKLYSLFFQMEKITRDRGSLRHDDRLDCVAGAARYFRESLKQNAERLAHKNRSNEMISLMQQVSKNGFKPSYAQPNRSNSASPLTKYGV
jgi:hypothetical protein